MVSETSLMSMPLKGLAASWSQVRSWLCASREMIPVLQAFVFGGGVNPYMSRVATYYMRDHMAPHVATLVSVYRDKRDAMLRALWETKQIHKGGFYHDGRFATVKDVVEHYNDHFTLSLTGEEKRNLIEYLKSL